MSFAYPGALLVAALALSLWRRSPLYPPAVYCAVWGAALAAVDLAGGRYVPIGEFTRGLYLLGATGFVLGGLVADLLVGTREGARHPRGEPLPDWVLNGLLVVSLVGLVVFGHRVFALASDLRSLGLLYAIRVQSLRAAEDPALALGPIGNVVPLAILAALTMLREPAPTAWAQSRRFLMFAAAMIASALTGTRAGGAALAVAAVVLLAMHPTDRRGFFLGVSAVSFVALFGALAILIRKGEARPDAIWQENAASVVRNFKDYALGGVVGFDQIASDPRSVPGVGGVLRTFHEMGNRLGADYDVPPLHAEYRTIGDAIDTNVYTTYFFYYPDFGLAGVFFFPAVVGAIATALYLRARAGQPLAVILAPIVIAGCFQSIFSEPFMTNVNFLAKAVVFLLLLELLRRVPVHAPARSAAAGRP